MLGNSLALLVTFPIEVHAAEKLASISYDVALREFTCWSEGSKVPAPADGNATSCSGAWKPITGDLYFLRGQSISVVLVNAVAIDLFGVELKVDDLPEPPVAVLGDFGTLPKLVPIPPAPSLTLGSGVTLATGEAKLNPGDFLYRLLVTADEKDFRAWVKEKLSDPLGAKELLDLLVTDASQATKALEARVPAIRTDADGIQAELQKVVEKGSTIQIIAAAKRLGIIIEKERALRDRTIVIGLLALSKPVMDLEKGFRAPVIQKVLAIDADGLDGFLSELNLALPPGSRYSRIEKIEVVSKEYVVKTEPEKTEMAKFLTRINADDGADADVTGLAKLKKNLGALLETVSELEQGQKRLVKLGEQQKTIKAYLTGADSILKLQDVLESNASLTIEQARAVNEASRSTALDANLSVMPLGFWYGSKEIAVTLKQGQRFPLFDIGGTADSTRTQATTGENPVAKAPTTAVLDLATTRTTKLRVYNTYRFQLGFGFVYSSARDDQFRLTRQPTTATPPVQQTFIEQVRSRNYNLLATADIVIFPTVRTNFPWKPRYLGERRPAWYRDIGALVGFSVTSPNRDFLLGGVWMPHRSPVGIKAGWHVALRDYPPAGTLLSTGLTDRTILLSQKRKDGLFVGLTFTTDFFGKVFAPIFKPQ